jgi:hypothetical protein
MITDIKTWLITQILGPEKGENFAWHMKFVDGFKYLYPYGDQVVAVSGRTTYASGRRGTPTHGSITNMVLHVDSILRYNAGWMDKIYADVMNDTIMTNQFGDDAWAGCVDPEFYEFMMSNVNTNLNFDMAEEALEKFLGRLYVKDHPFYGKTDVWTTLLKRYSPEGVKHPIANQIGHYATVLLLQDTLGKAKGLEIAKRLEKDLQTNGYLAKDGSGHVVVEKIDFTFTDGDPVERIKELSRELPDGIVNANVFSELVYGLFNLGIDFEELYTTSETIQEAEKNLAGYEHQAATELMTALEDAAPMIDVTSLSKQITMMLKTSDIKAKTQIAKEIYLQTLPIIH